MGRTRSSSTVRAHAQAPPLCARASLIPAYILLRRCPWGWAPLCPAELYNEPFLGYYDGMDAGAVAECFANGGCDTYLNDGSGAMSGHTAEGVSPMISAIRENAPEGLLVLPGPRGWAYEASLLTEYVRSSAVQNVLLNIHPYMGPYQDCDPAFDKSPRGVDRLLSTLAASGRPLIMTEFGQYCCPDPANGEPSGVCSDGAAGAGADYDGTWAGKTMSYNDAILTIGAGYGISWTAWAWVPGGVKVGEEMGVASCAYPMLNDGGTQLIGQTPTSYGKGSLDAPAKCDSSITIHSASRGVNATAMWRRFYAV
jgi:hypothetical protein